MTACGVRDGAIFGPTQSLREFGLLIRDAGLLP